MNPVRDIGGTPGALLVKAYVRDLEAKDCMSSVGPVSLHVRSDCSSAYSCVCCMSVMFTPLAASGVFCLFVCLFCFVSGGFGFVFVLFCFCFCFLFLF